MFLASLCKCDAIGLAFGKKSEALEDRSIVQADGVLDNLIVVPVLASEVDSQTVGDVLDTAAKRRIVDHVDYRTMQVRYGYACSMAPNACRAKNLPLRDVLQREMHALSQLVLLTHWL
jgi:hypothetical protein